MPEGIPNEDITTTEDTAPSPKAASMLGRWLTFLLGVFVMSVGIALSVHGQLGTAPISTFPAVIDAASSWSVGGVTAVMNAVFVVIQIIIL